MREDLGGITRFEAVYGCVCAFWLLRWSLAVVEVFGREWTDIAFAYYRRGLAACVREDSQSLYL